MLNFNFLPTKYRQKLKIEILSRFFWVLSIAVVFWAVVFGVVMIAAIQYLSIQNEALQQRIETVSSQEKTIEAEQIEKDINEFNALLTRIKDIKQNNPHDGVEILEHLAPVVPEGVQLASLSFNAQTGRVFLGGHAELRTQVITMQNSLEGDPLFSEVEAPLSNLLNAEDIDFQFTLTLANGTSD